MLAHMNSVIGTVPGTLRGRFARLERPLLLGGLALVTVHLLDLAFSGPDTTLLGVAVIVAAPLAWALAQPRVTRPTRAALGVAFGLLAVGFGVVSHGLHAVNSGPDWTDVTGLGFLAGGLLLLGSAGAALGAPRRAARRRRAPGWRAAHAVGWVTGAMLVAYFAVMPTALGVMVTHAPRWSIHESALGVAHRKVRVATADGNELSAWYVPSQNGAAVLVSHGSGGSRGRVVDRIEMLARHGYGVLALDLAAEGDPEAHDPLGPHVGSAGEVVHGGVDRRLGVVAKPVGAPLALTVARRGAHRSRRA
jgi:hypothetical protein